MSDVPVLTTFITLVKLIPIKNLDKFEILASVKRKFIVEWLISISQSSSSHSFGSIRFG